MVYLNRSEAFDLLKSDDMSSSDDFFYFQQGWEVQINQAYCTVASIAAVMNSLRGQISLPYDQTYNPYPWATQLEIMRNKCVWDKVMQWSSDNSHLYFGLGLDMAKQVLDCHFAGQNMDVVATHVDPATTTVRDVREAIKAGLFERNARVMINYDRGLVSQGNLGHGHFSPIGAYNHDMDAFLIMDVAKYKYPPVWVPAAKLFWSMASPDFCAQYTLPQEMPDLSNKSYAEKVREIGCKLNYRGFIVVKSAR